MAVPDSNESQKSSEELNAFEAILPALLAAALSFWLVK